MAVYGKVYGVMSIRKIFANIIYEEIGLIRQLVRTMRSATKAAIKSSTCLFLYIAILRQCVRWNINR